jgi:outer membrane autotransporter protein
VSHGGTFERTRLGVEINRSLVSGDVRWMPYASLHAVHDSGTGTYTVNGVFHGSTSTSGTSAMAEIGLGMEKGGFGATLSANWKDGGAYKTINGVQANLRYSW